MTDRSSSIEHGDGAACAAVARLTQAALAEESPFAKGDLLAGLGNNLERNEPTTIELWATAAKTMPGTPLRLAEGQMERQAVLEDFEATVRLRKRRAAAIASQFSDSCRNEASQQAVSPIYSALSAAVSSLKNGCPSASECLLIVQSDLAETFEPGLKATVTAILKGKTERGTNKPQPIDLENRISVFVCGFAASTDVVSEASRRQVLSLWRDHILTQPKRWVEQPLCPGYRPTS